MWKLVGVVALAFVVLGPRAYALEACDISDLRCARDGKTCNIEFANRTRFKEESPCSGQSLASDTLIKVRAQDASRKTLGNVLSIESDKTNSLNLDKKDNFARVMISAPNDKRIDRIELSCDDVRRILTSIEGIRHDPKCKVYFMENVSGGVQNTKKKYYIETACNTSAQGDGTKTYVCRKSANQ